MNSSVGSSRNTFVMQKYPNKASTFDLKSEEFTNTLIKGSILPKEISASKKQF